MILHHKQYMYSACLYIKRNQALFCSQQNVYPSFDNGMLWHANKNKPYYSYIHIEDQTIVKSFYLHTGISNVEKMPFLSWWRHEMETFSALLALYAGNSPELWCFLWSAPEHTVVLAIEAPVIWDAIALVMTSL